MDDVEVDNPYVVAAMEKRGTPSFMPAGMDSLFCLAVIASKKTIMFFF
jgi:hypothetical protein